MDVSLCLVTELLKKTKISEEPKWWDDISISLACNRIQDLKAKQYVSMELTFEPGTHKFSAGWAFVVLY
jgi:hypothetical protein